MKRITLIATSILGLVVVGITTARVVGLDKTLPYPEATIVYRLTEYDVEGRAVAISEMIRRQWADGSWHNHQVFANGTVREAKGRVNTDLLPDPAEHWVQANKQSLRTFEHLGYRVSISEDERGETWYAPDLGAMLKETKYTKEGTVSLVLEAVEIRPGDVQ